ncbi:MFS transporter [Corynebacterium pilbarense]
MADNQTLQRSTSSEVRKSEATGESAGVGKIAFSSFVGTALEWYDFFLFGTASALVFNHLFFATQSPTVALLSSFATFGVGFLARPFGAILFGKMGDRYGRRPALILSIVVIGAATGFIGLLPTYFTIGIAAPILLTLARLAQGIAVGGEWGGATTLALEHAPEEKRARYAALVQAGSPVGTLLSSGAFALVFLLPAETVDSWAWRLPFLAAFPFLLVALVIRMQVEESPVYQAFADEAEQEEKQQEGSVRLLLSQSGASVFWAVCASLVGIGGFFIMSTYVLSYGTNELGVDRQPMVNATLLGALAQLTTLLIFGRLGEKVGADKIVGWGGIATVILAVPLWAMVNTGNIAWITLAIILGLSVVTVPYSVVGVVLTELFPVQYRYTGVALSANIAAAISGLLPFLITWLNTFTDGPSIWPAAGVLIGIGVLTAAGGIAARRHMASDNVVSAP